MFGLVAGDIVPIVAVRLRSGLCFVVVSERLQHWPCCGARTDFFWRKLNPKETKPGGGDATNGFAANAIDTGSAVVANGSFLLLVFGLVCQSPPTSPKGKRCTQANVSRQDR